MLQSSKSGDGDAGQQADEGVDALKLFGSTHFIVGVHKILDFCIRAEQTGFAFVVIGFLDDAVQTHCFAHGVHLGHFGGMAVVPCPQGHGHFQRESCTAGHPQFHQTEDTVDEAGGKGQCQQRTDSETTFQQFAQRVQHHIAAQKRGDHHGQHLRENHQPEPVFGDQVHGEHGSGTGTQQHNDQICENCQL